MSSNLQHAPPVTPEHASQTARHMSDSLGYLIYVATDSGLDRIAAQLAMLRVELIETAAAMECGERAEHIRRGTSSEPEACAGRRDASSDRASRHPIVSKRTA